MNRAHQCGFLCAPVAEKLRREKLVAGSLNVLLETNRFSQEPQYANAVMLGLAPLSDITFELTAIALRGIEAFFRPGFKYKRAGVPLTNLAPAASLIMRLWNNAKNE